MPDITTTLRVPRYASAPGSPLTGQVYFDTTTGFLYFYSGTAWIQSSVPSIIPAGVVTQIYIGNKARFTALSNGLRLEIQNTGGTWITQAEWTE
jgi:hypothetical protein